MLSLHSPRSFVLAALAAVGLLVPASPTLAQEAADNRIVLELNTATDTDNGACRLTFVALNNTPTGFARTGWQVGIFDASGIVRSILALEFGALPVGKTKIVQFDLAGQGCQNISRVVVNDVTLCQPEGGEDGVLASACLEALSTTSRASIEFGI